MEMAQTKNAETKSQSAKVAFGVEALIERLRSEGVGSGRAGAEKIVKDAQAEAQSILSKAKAEADQIVDRARTDAANLEKAGRQSLEVAARDTALDLKNRLSQRAAREVKHLVNEAVQRQEILEKLILEVAGQAREKAVGAGAVEILLPQKVISLDDIAKDPGQPASQARSVIRHRKNWPNSRPSITSEKRKLVSLHFVESLPCPMPRKPA
jgi:V/A-type H+-transporting ATPase subunit E